MKAKATKKKATVRRKAVRRERVLSVRLNDDEYQQITTAAGPYPAGIWSRINLVEAAARAGKKGGAE